LNNLQFVELFKGQRDKLKKTLSNIRDKMDDLSNELRELRDRAETQEEGGTTP
jgi:uncharacterized coiled-coil DUF342 family protein